MALVRVEESVITLLLALLYDRVGQERKLMLSILQLNVVIASLVESVIIIYEVNPMLVSGQVQELV